MSGRAFLVALTLALLARSQVAMGQPPAPASPDASRKFEIIDNLFLVEESFNQERGVVQNIFTWTRGRDGTWNASFTQEWPAPGMTHQLSYTLPFSRTGGVTGIGDVLVNYRYQLRTETAGAPAISPRVSVILPTGREADGLGSGVVGLQLNVPASKQFGDFYVHANAGYTWLPDVERTPHVAGSGIWRATPMFHLTLEAVVELGNTVTVAPGFRRGWNFGDCQLVVGAALPVSRTEGQSDVALLTYFSYELPFRRSTVGSADPPGHR
jgi:hypothetical protein